MPGVTLRFSDALADGELAEVTALLEQAAAADHSPPLNEAGLLHLQHPRPTVSHLGAWRNDHLVGYAQLDVGPDAATGQLLVSPADRRHGIGTALVTQLLARSSRPLRIWAAGDKPEAQALARRTGLVARRTLLIMRRPLTDELPEPRVPPGVDIRTFVPGRDEQAWLAVNRRAFAHHPEQGAVTAADLAERMSEAWFDPAGFFLAESAGEKQPGGAGVPGGRLLGFHWTKRHDDRLGEVYVIGVDPTAESHGLGTALLLTGLHHLQRQGLVEVQLYVEADHERAVRLYSGYGFAPASRDVMYAQP